MPFKRIHDFIFHLYSTSLRAQLSSFKTAVLEDTAQILQFDAALWVTSDIRSESFCTAASFGGQESLIDDFDRDRHSGTNLLQIAATAHPGATINSRALARQYSDAKATTTAGDLQASPFPHALCTTLIDSVTKTENTVLLYRKNSAGPFTEYDRQCAEYLVPHMFQALKVNLWTNLMETEERPIAIADARGHLYLATSRFAEVLQAQDADWNGRRLSIPFDTLDGQTSRRWEHGALRFEARPLQDLFLISVGSPKKTDMLTPRQFEIAAMLVEGKQYKSIARSLSITPSTVTKHVNEIHSRLGVNTREALISVFKGSERSPLRL